MSNQPPNWKKNTPGIARTYALGSTCHRNNALAQYSGGSGTRWNAMPQKFYPSAGNSMFSNNRSVFSKVVEENNTIKYQDSSQRTASLRSKAIGKSSIPSTTTTQLSFSNTNTNIVNDISRAKRRTRAGGAVAPPKKAANTSFKSGGGCCS